MYIAVYLEGGGEEEFRKHVYQLAALLPEHLKASTQVDILENTVRYIQEIESVISAEKLFAQEKKKNSSDSASLPKRTKRP